jgi:DNA-directed RNA polymerase specialized sigma24 family protein
VSWGGALAQPLAEDAPVAAEGSAVDRLRGLLAELPPRQAEAVVLCDVMGLDTGDVAVTLRVGVDHVRRRLRAGHERLARQMALETHR